jgi:hypothetical protein
VVVPDAQIDVLCAAAHAALSAALGQRGSAHGLREFVQHCSAALTEMDAVQAVPQP